MKRSDNLNFRILYIKIDNLPAIILNQTIGEEIKKREEQRGKRDYFNRR